MRIAFAVFAFAAIAVLACACGRDEQSQPSAQAETAASPNGQPQQYAGVELLPPDSGLIRDLLPKTSESQKTVLQDGKLTLEEFEQLGLAEGQCLIDAGLSVDRSKIHLNGAAQFSYTIDLGEDFSKADRDTISRCSTEFTQEVKMVWAEMSAPVVEHVAKEFRQWTANCLADGGLRVEDQPWISGNTDDQRTAGECTRAAQEIFDTGNLAFGVEGDGKGP